MPKVVSVFERVREFESEGFYVFDKAKQIIMCKFCNQRIEWQRRDTCVKHCTKSTTHKERKKAAERSGSSKRQLSVQQCATSSAMKSAKLDRKQFVCATTKAFMAANIPLEKLDTPALREWFTTYVEGAGDMPKAEALRQNYVPLVHEEQVEQIKQCLRGKKVAVFCDETTDKKGQCVFIVLFKTITDAKEQDLVIGSVSVLQSATATECSRAQLDCFSKYEVKYDDIVCIVSDSARYMTKCINSMKVLLSEDLLHVQCWDHKLSLVQSLFPQALPELNECVSKTKHLFQNTRKRKHNYLAFLRAKYPEGEKASKLFPSPVLTRWNSWYLAVKYVVDIVEYVSTLDQSVPAVVYFKGFSQSDITVITCQATFVVEHFETLSNYIVELEAGRKPLAHKLFGKIGDLKNSFELLADGVVGDKTTVVIKTLSTVQAGQVKVQLKNLGTKCLTKLNQLISEDPARECFKSMGALFDFRNIASNTADDRLYALTQKVPVLKVIDKLDFLKGYKALQNSVKNQDCGNIIDTVVGLKEEHPVFASLTAKVLWLPVTNVDCERAFSAYSNVQTDKRFNLKPSNLEIMLTAYFN